MDYPFTSYLRMKRAEFLSSPVGSVRIKTDNYMKKTFTPDGAPISGEARLGLENYARETQGSGAEKLRQQSYEQTSVTPSEP